MALVETGDPRVWYFTYGLENEKSGSYMVVEGATYEKARRLIMAMEDNRWAFTYSPQEFDTSKFPKGCSLRIVVEQ